MTPAHIKRTSRVVVSRNEFTTRTRLDELDQLLRAAKATGKLTVNYSQGGLNSIVFEANHKLNGHDHVELVFTAPETK